jgi:hypothetical protein
MSLYATLDDVKSEMNAEGTLDDNQILRGLRQVSARVDEEFKRGRNLFVPTIATRSFVPSPYAINSVDRTLALSFPLLSLTSASIGTQGLSVGSVVNPYGESPYTLLQLACCAGYSWYGYCSDGASASIAGVWGYHDDYANAWLEVTTLSDGITASDTVLSVEDLDGPNDYGDSPLISPGNLIQIDDEWMDVTAATTTTDEDTLISTFTITVRRAVNGSTAAVHLVNAPISVYQVNETIRRAVVRQVAAQYARKGAFETRKITDFGAVDYPSDTLAEYRALLNYFANL